MKKVPLPLHEKFKLIRVAKGISQFSLGTFLGRNTKFVSRLENGETEMSPDVLSRIRKFLEVETAPLFDNELTVYKSRLRVWRESINTNRVQEAVRLQKELSVILDLPYEHDLIIMYQMMESRLLFFNRDMSAIQERIDSATPFVYEMSTDARHLYHYIMGIFYFMQTVLPFTQTIDSDVGKKKEILSKALEHFLLSLDFEKESVDFNNDATLLAAIGNTYIGLGKPFRALSFLERTLITYGGNYVEGIRKMGRSIAACHFQIGDYEQAKKMLEEVLLHEQAENNRLAIAVNLSDLALTNLMLGNPSEALMQCEESLPLAKDDKLLYLICLSCKAKIMMNMKKLADAKAIVKEGKQLAVGEQEIVGVVFETFGHLMNLAGYLSGNDYWIGLSGFNHKPPPDTKLINKIAKQLTVWQFFKWVYSNAIVFEIIITRQ